MKIAGVIATLRARYLVSRRYASAHPQARARARAIISFAKEAGLFCRYSCVRIVAIYSLDPAEYPGRSGYVLDTRAPAVKLVFSVRVRLSAYRKTAK